MYYITRSPSLQRLGHQEARWIVYQLQLQGIRQKEVAHISGMSVTTVSDVLNCKKSSAAVYATICKLLGYGSMAQLLTEARRSVA